MPKVGRVLYAVPLAVFGLLHFMNGPAMAGMVPIPGGVVWVYLTGLALIAATAAIVTGREAVLATRLLGVMLLIFAVSIHLRGVLGAADEMAMAASMGNLLKDTALAGAAWFMSGAVGQRRSE
ncbi:MAG: DoxX family protein [Gemmatimonadota bacterium]